MKHLFASVERRGAEQSRLPLSEIAAPLSSSAARLPAPSSERVLCPEPPSCRCTAGAQAGWAELGTPDLGSDPDPDPGPVQPWRPAGPLDVAQTDPETPRDHFICAALKLTERRQIRKIKLVILNTFFSCG